MLAKSIVLLLSAGLAAAHFQMQFPIPRGPFVEDDEPTFCDGYTDAVSNRSEFPLNGGFISFNSEHPQWTAGITISLEQNPTNFSVFNTTTNGTQLPFIVPFFQSSGEGLACIELDIGALNIPGVGNGTNVTLQMEFNGGDGNLFQCADLTLSSTFTIPSNISCMHIVLNNTNQTTASGSTATSTAPGSASSTSTSSSGAMQLAAGSTGLLGLVAALFFSAL